MSDVLERLRALRRDGYRCRHRDALGVPCGVPASRVRAVDGDLLTVCFEHAA